DEQTRWRATQTIMELGPEAKQLATALRSALRDANDPCRPHFAAALWHAERQNKDRQVSPAVRREVLNALTDALQRPNGPRRSAIACLGHLGPDAGEAVPALIPALGGPDAYVRAEALELLARLGPAAKAALPAVRERLKDESFDARTCAVAAVCRITPEDPEAISLVVRFLEDYPNSLPRLEDTLSALVPRAKHAAPYLRRALRPSNRDIYLS